jgi:hypothetical protein
MRHVLRPIPLASSFAVLGGAIALAHYTVAAWWIVPLGALGPDLSFLAAIGGPGNVDGNMPPRVVGPYNLVHHPFGPIALVVAGAVCRSPTAVCVALAWGSHLLWDRGVGYGMRRADGTIIEPPRRTRNPPLVG